MIVVAYDPGAWLGWAALAVDAAGPRFLAGGVIAVEDVGEDAARDEALHHATVVCAELVAIERPEGIAPGTVRAMVAKHAGATLSSMSLRLVEAAWIGADLAAANRAVGRQVLKVPAGMVRAHYIESDPRARKARDLDAAAREVVERFVLWPEKIRGTGRAYRKDGSDLMAERRAHVFDAALLALYAGTVLAPRPAVAGTPPRQLTLAEVL